MVRYGNFLFQTGPSSNITLQVYLAITHPLSHHLLLVPYSIFIFPLSILPLSSFSGQEISSKSLAIKTSVKTNPFHSCMCKFPSITLPPCHVVSHHIISLLIHFLLEISAYSLFYVYGMTTNFMCSKFSDPKSPKVWSFRRYWRRKHLKLRWRKSPLFNTSPSLFLLLFLPCPVLTMICRIIFTFVSNNATVGRPWLPSKVSLQNMIKREF